MKTGQWYGVDHIYSAVIIKLNSTARKCEYHYKGQRLSVLMVYGMPLKNVFGQSFMVKIRTFGSSLEYIERGMK